MLESMDVEWKFLNNRDIGSVLGRGLVNMMVFLVMLLWESEVNMVWKIRRFFLKCLKSLLCVFVCLKLI